MPKKIDKVDQFIRDLRSVNYYNQVIIEYNLKLEVIELKMYGVSSPNVKEIIYENIGNPYSDKQKIELLDKKQALLHERQIYINRIMECENIELIKNDRDKNMIIDLYVVKMKYKDVMRNYNYSKSTMFDKAKKIISEIL